MKNLDPKIGSDVNTTTNSIENGIVTKLIKLQNSVFLFTRFLLLISNITSSRIKTLSSIYFNSYFKYRYCLLIVGLLMIYNSSKVFSQEIKAAVKTVVGNETFSIQSIKTTDETRSGGIDGKMIIKLSKPLNSKFNVFFDLHKPGNKQVKYNITATNGIIEIQNMFIGEYFNIFVEDISSNYLSEIVDEKFIISHATEDRNKLNQRASCGNIRWTDCDGTTRSQSGLENNNYINTTSGFRPCLMFVNPSCTAQNNIRVHCINGNLSVPPFYNNYSITNYEGVGLTALTACRLNWILCNYNFNNTGVAEAIWALTNTGGRTNSIYFAATNNVPAINGAQNSAKFYKSTNPSYQNMIEWSCQSPCTATVSISGYTGICAGNSETLTAKAVNGDAPYSYVWYSSSNIQTIQAEAGTVGNGAQFQIIQQNFHGSSYVEFFNTNGEYVNIPVSITTAGSYNVKVRYALSDVSTINSRFSINGTSLGDFDFVGTISGNDWEYQDLGNFSLNSGTNNLRFTNIANNAPDIDEIIISPAGAVVGTNASLIVSPTKSTTYIVSVTDNNDCTATASHTLTASTTNITVEISTDQYPTETSWNIKNSAGVVLVNSEKYTLPYTLNVHTYCLPSDCYTFTINDVYADGILAPGYFKVSQGSSVILSNSSFTTSKTVNFCLGGALPPTCSDRIKNGYETGVDCGGNCAPCPTCGDGIKNGNETGVDCGGPCFTCYTRPGTTVSGAYFEQDWEGWIDGGSECFRYSGDYSAEGSYSIRLRENRGTQSSMTTPRFDLSSFATVTFEFKFRAVGMETGKDFWLLYHNGWYWTNIGTYVSGESFVNNQVYTIIKTLTGPFPSNAKFRLQCDASGNDDEVYIDAVVIRGIGATNQNNEVMLSNRNIMYKESEEIGFSIIPNPADNVIQIKMDDQITKIKVFNLAGQIMTLPPADVNNIMDISRLNNGMYIIQVEAENGIFTKKLIKK